LTDATHGNAIGIGMADVVSTRLLSKLDQPKTIRNALTALTPQSAKIPIAMDTDREAIEAMLASLPIEDMRTARVARIANTLELSELAVSEPLLEEALRAGKIERCATPWPPLELGAGL
jgi:hypothetical protein